jgi:hypothetical protein
MTPMRGEPIFTWDGHEYTFEEHGPDWYWALGIVAAAAALVSILFGNVLLALVIAAGAVAVALQSAKHKRTHRFEIHEHGIAVDEAFYPYESMRDFAILEFIDPSLPPALSLKTNHILAPHLLIPIHEYDPEDVYEYVNIHVPEGNHEETLLDRFTTFLRL